MWTKIDSHRWNKTENGIVVGCIYPTPDGGLKAWKWPLGQGQRTDLGTFLSKSRAMEAVDA